jgi:hypothetical protein
MTVARRVLAPGNGVRAMRHMLVFALALTGCVAANEPPAKPASSCAAGLEPWVMTELFFGLTWAQGVITEEQFQDFVNRDVVPRIPEGFTIVQAEGAWRSSRTGQTIRQPSRVLMRLRKNDPAQDRAIAEIIAAYKTRFAQQSVLRVDSTACAAF